MSPTLTFTGSGLTLTGTGFTFGIPVSVTAAAAGGGGGGNSEDMSITLASTSFNDGDTVGTTYKFSFCSGDNTSPQLNWTVTGSNTNVAEFRLRCIDIDASNFVHWSVDNIDPSSSSLAENADWTSDQSADGNGVTINITDFGNGGSFDRSNGWAGPCPPSGTHTYQFQLTAHDSNGDAVTQGGSALASNTISFERS